MATIHNGLSRTVLAACLVYISLPGIARAQQDRSNDALHKLNDSVDALIRKVSPSMVQILVKGYGPLESGDHGNTSTVIGLQRAIGSGFVVDADGYILTNAHVVAGAQEVQVLLPEENFAAGSTSPATSMPLEMAPARIVGVARQVDLALLKVDNHKMQPLPFASYRNLRQGEVVLAFGSPEGLRNSVTLGVVSSVARQTDPDSAMAYVQTDAPINPGNSGGPLVNADGEVVGVNTFILSQSGGNEGLGFAIPSNIAKLAYQQLRKYGHVHHTEIGIGVQTITPILAEALKLPRTYGVIVSDVLPSGPADLAGVHIGDVLLSVDGRDAESVPYVSFRLLSVDVGTKVHIEVLRGTERIPFDVEAMEQERDMDQITTLADPEKNLVPALGILGIEVDQKIVSMVPELRSHYGIVVAARSNNSSVDVPLTAGDVILSLNGEPMKTLDQLRTTLKALKTGTPVVLQIQRDQQLQYVSFLAEASP